MKSRLSSYPIWTLVIANGVVLFAVLLLAYSAGRQSGGASIFDFGALPSGASGLRAAGGRARVGHGHFHRMAAGRWLAQARAGACRILRAPRCGRSSRARGSYHYGTKLGYIADN